MTHAAAEAVKSTRSAAALDECRRSPYYARPYRQSRADKTRQRKLVQHSIDAGWSSLVARRAHNPKVVGSNPAPATKLKKAHHKVGLFYFRISGLMRNNRAGITVVTAQSCPHSTSAQNCKIKDDIPQPTCSVLSCLKSCTARLTSPLLIIERSAALARPPHQPFHKASRAA